MTTIVFHSFNGGVGRSTLALATGVVLARSGPVIVAGSDDLFPLSAVAAPLPAHAGFAEVAPQLTVANAMGINDYLTPQTTSFVWDGPIPVELAEQLPPNRPFNVVCLNNSYISLHNTLRAVQQDLFTVDAAIVTVTTTGALNANDASRCLLPLPPERVVVVEHSPHIARTVDAGLLVARVPWTLRASIDRLLELAAPIKELR